LPEHSRIAWVSESALNFHGFDHLPDAELWFFRAKLTELIDIELVEM
jgi:hypothetical protein